MINCVIRPICSIVLLFCLATAWADPGQTFRNGGGDAELSFVKIWHALESRLSACLHPIDPCNLNPKTRTLISKLVEFKKNCFPKVRAKFFDDKNMSHGSCGETMMVNADQLFDGNRILSEVEMTALALHVLQHHSCESALQLPDFKAVAEAAATITYFEPFELNGTNYFIQGRKTPTGEVLTVQVNALKVEVNALLRSRYPQLPGEVTYLSLSSGPKQGKVDLRGHIQGPNGRQSPFFISLNPNLDLATAFVYMLP